MGIGKKDKVLGVLDRIYMRLLTTRYFFSKRETLYHPVTIDSGEVRAKREQGTYERVDLIESILGQEPSSVLDIGSAEGYFSMALAKKGNFVVAIEGKKQRAMIGQITARMHAINNVSFYNFNLDIDVAKTLPSFDNVLCLAVWHHWIRLQDLNYANELLKIIWSKTNKRMFFETGLTELPAEFNLEGRDETWLLANIKSVLGNVKLTKLAETSSFSSEQFLESGTKHDSEIFKRKLYLIERV